MMSVSAPAPGWSGAATRRIHRILIANRGEVAVRVIATARRLGIETVVVFADPDRDSLAVRSADLAVGLPGETAAQTYLDIAAVIAAAERVGADAVHPGYGFLAENADFAAAVADAGLLWVGPEPAAIAAMASKVSAKRIAAAAGVPLLPGRDLAPDVSDADLLAAGEQVGYPLLIKASSGGGGRGMRIVPDPAELPGAVLAASREAAAAFGDPTVFLERYLAAARHVEVQVFADQHGRALHLHDRDCSVQRRHQKLIEEAPAPGLDARVRTGMAAAAVELAGRIGYTGAGTVEFLVTGSGTGQEFFFLEMNTRLQVEHRVTELITGHDLVAWQLLAAQGYRLDLAQDDITQSGHALEVRLCAEDPARGFLPGAGRLEAFEVAGTSAVSSAHPAPVMPATSAAPDVSEPPAAVARTLVDAGFEAGDEVPRHYDSLLAKIVTHGPGRAAAIDQMVVALQATRIRGMPGNRDWLLAAVGSQAFRSGQVTTGFVDQHPELAAEPFPAPDEPLLAVAAAFAHWDSVGSLSLADPVPARWRNVRGTPGVVGLRAGSQQWWVLLERIVGGEWEAALVAGPDPFSGDREPLGEIRVTGPRVTPSGVSRYRANWPDTAAQLASASEGATGPIVINLERDAVVTRFEIRRTGDDEIHVRSPLGSATFLVADPTLAAASEGAGGGPVSPVPGTVIELLVDPGDGVESGQAVAVVEAMKMEHRILADATGVVEDVLVVPGQAVEAHQTLVVISATGSAGTDPEEAGVEHE